MYIGFTINLLERRAVTLTVAASAWQDFLRVRLLKTPLLRFYFANRQEMFLDEEPSSSSWLLLFFSPVPPPSFLSYEEGPSTW